MKLLLFTVLLSIIQAAAPIPRQAPDSTNQRANKRDKKANQHQDQIAPTPTPKQLTEKAISENTATNKPASPDTEQSVRIRELPSVSVARDWMDRTAWAFGAILVVVGIVGVCAAYRTLRVIARQTTAIEKQAEAMINAERAWVIAELVPICVQVGKWWHRPAGNGWAALTEEEVLNGDHLKHKLKLTNMGRTPAHILRYRLIYSCLDKGVTSLSGKIAERQDSHRIFDHLLGATDSIEVPEMIHIDKYIFSKIKGIKELDNTAVFHGWVKYQHVFNNSEVVTAPFWYVYKPSTIGLERVPEVIARYQAEDEKTENQSPN